MGSFSGQPVLPLPLSRCCLTTSPTSGFRVRPAHRGATNVGATFWNTSLGRSPTRSEAARGVDSRSGNDEKVRGDQGVPPGPELGAEVSWTRLVDGRAPCVESGFAITSGENELSPGSAELAVVALTSRGLPGHVVLRSGRMPPRSSDLGLVAPALQGLRLSWFERGTS